MLKTTDADGNEIELPFDSIEEAQEAKESANPDWKTAREKLKEAESSSKERREVLEAKGVKFDEQGKIVPEEVKEEKKEEEKDTRTPQEVYNDEREKEVSEATNEIISKESGGDENRKKVIEEKFNLLKGDKKITTIKQAEALLADAVILANKITNAPEPAVNINTVNNSGLGLGSAPKRDISNDEANKAASNLEEMGYKFRGDKSKVLEKASKK